MSATLLAVAGTWFLTSAPPWPEPPAVTRQRMSLRWLAAFAVVLLLALLAMPFGYMTWAWDGWGPLRQAAQAPLWAIEVPHVVRLLGYLRHVARRTDDRALPRRLKRLAMFAGAHVALLALPQLVRVVLRTVIAVRPPAWLGAMELLVLFTPPITVMTALALYRLDRAAARAMKARASTDR